MKIVKTLKGKVYEDQLKSLDVLSAEQMSFMVAAASDREWRAVLSSALCDSDRA